MKNLFKKKANPQAPRPFSEIEKDYREVSSQASNAQYQAFVYSEQLRLLNKRMLEINKEADERRKLDEQVKAELAKKEASTVKPSEQVDLTKSGAV